MLFFTFNLNLVANNHSLPPVFAHEDSNWKATQVYPYPHNSAPRFQPQDQVSKVDFLDKFRCFPPNFQSTVVIPSPSLPPHFQSRAPRPRCSPKNLEFFTRETFPAINQLIEWRCRKVTSDCYLKRFMVSQKRHGNAYWNNWRGGFILKSAVR